MPPIDAMYEDVHDDHGDRLSAEAAAHDKVLALLLTNTHQYEAQQWVPELASIVPCHGQQWLQAMSPSLRCHPQILVLEDVVDRLSHELAQRQGHRAALDAQSGSHASWVRGVEDLPPLLLAYDQQMQRITQKLEQTADKLEAAQAQARRSGKTCKFS